MQKKLGCDVLRSAAGPDIAQLFAILLPGYLKGRGGRWLQRPPGRVQSGNWPGWTFRPNRRRDGAIRSTIAAASSSLPPGVQVAAIVPIEGFRVVKENSGQVKVMDALILQIPVNRSAGDNPAPQ